MHKTTHDSNPRDSAVGRRVQKSRAFRIAQMRAAEYLRQPTKLKSLAERAAGKATRVAPRWAQKILDWLLAMIRLLRAYWIGSYRDVDAADLLIIVAAVVYFVMPLDLIPDWIPVAGFVDDASVVAAALKAVRDALERFIAWEKQRAADVRE